MIGTECDSGSSMHPWIIIKEYPGITNWISSTKTSKPFLVFGSSRKFHGKLRVKHDLLLSRVFLRTNIWWKLKVKMSCYFICITFNSCVCISDLKTQDEVRHTRLESATGVFVHQDVQNISLPLILHLDFKGLLRFMSQQDPGFGVGGQCLAYHEFIFRTKSVE